jgi:PTS system ascorbate-specific IIB component
MKVLVACGAGMGSSQLIKLKAQKVLKELGIDNDITHTSIEEARSMAKSYDLVIVNERFVDTLPAGSKAIGLKNLLDEKELKEKLAAIGIK